MDVGINDLTIGYSFTGAAEYVRQLNTKAITETKQKLAALEGVREALNKGWAGQARMNYVANLQKSVVLVQNTLDELKRALEAQFAQIEQSMAEQDANIVPMS